MAETIVSFVLEKLGDVAVKEVLLIYGIDEQVEKVRRDLERIQAFLKDADRKHITDERQKHWVKEVREVAHLIEDVIDTFLLEAPPKPTESTSIIMKVVERVIKKAKQIPPVHKLSDEINKIQTRLEEIKASRETFGINNLGEGTGEITLPVRPPVIPDIDPNVVGFKKDLDHVANLLIDKTIKRRSVISIWGVGGLGKTTLARKVYNSCHIEYRNGMAETIVNFVLEKLVDVAVKQVLLIHGVDEQVEKVRRDLERIQAFLKDADKKHLTDERQKHWVKEVRDVAHLIEDVIDTFLLEVPPKPTESTGIMKAMIRLIKKPKTLTAVHELIDEIKKIQTRLEEIKASRETFGINNLGEGTGVITLPVRPPVIPDIDPNVVGFKKDLDHVANLLLDETVKRRSVISIWGVGGLGKTTLARKVYNREDVKTQFECRIWIDISQKFELIDILRKIGEQLQQTNTNGSLGQLHQSLKGKKYLIVLDDVWTNDLWTQIEEALPNENNGSRVLLSTRFFNVAKHADPACDPYKLGLLTKELSLELLLKKALPNQDPTKIANLSDIIDQFVHKCNGLPLALVLLGSLLATKPLNHATWNKVLQTMGWFADGNKIIGTSYEDLPFGLKSCFMYIAAFPEDYEIDAIALLRLWVAEGFIPKEDRRTLEETAESFLEDLVQRSMVQVTSRSEDGSIEYCRIHDLLRDLALQKAKVDNFLIVYSHTDDQHNLCMARRVAVHNSDCDELVMSKNLRTLLCFRTKCMPNCSKQRMLKVVSMERLPGAAIEINLEMFEGLTQLRYLDLEGKIASRENRSLGEMIGNMKFLQTVSTRVWENDIQLRLSGHKALRHVTGFKVKLSSSAKLPNLQTLDGVICDESWEAPYVPNLRTLDLIPSSSSWEAADAFLSTLKNLISLNLKTRLSFNGKLDMRDFPFYQNLQSLDLISDSTELIDMPIDMPPHLTSLYLCKLKFRQDIMPALEKLQYLKELWLLSLDTNEKMCCSAKGFSQLEHLSIQNNVSLKDWEIEEGAMPILRKLFIRLPRNFSVPQGLRYLTNLQELWWHERPIDPERANEIRHLCKHVPSVSIKEFY